MPPAQEGTIKGQWRSARILGLLALGTEPRYLPLPLVNVFRVNNGSFCGFLFSAITVKACSPS